MELRQEGRQDRECQYCGMPETIEPVSEHHLYKRGSHPHMIDDPKNKVWLCGTHHYKTEVDHEFYILLQQMFYGDHKDNH
jgi:hypothetical protein